MADFRGRLWVTAILGANSVTGPGVAETDLPSNIIERQHALRQAAIEEVENRDVLFPEYPQHNMTYLSFDRLFGFQIIAFGQNREAWFWTQDDDEVEEARYGFDLAAGKGLLCWRYPTRQNRLERCVDRDFAKKTMISALPGDPFNLASRRAPGLLAKCQAPEVFTFDRQKYRC